METEKRREIWLPIVLLAFLTCVLAARSFFSFCQSDESFYAALTHRLWMGEHMITDEWNSTQFYVPIVVPFYSLYIAVRGSTDGVLLFLRLLYLLFAVITGGRLFFLSLKETKSGFYALLSAAIVLLFSRGNIQGVSYYNLCMLCNVSAFCSFMAAFEHTAAARNLLLLWTGVQLACAVLCNPFLAPLVMAAFLVVLLTTRYKREIIWVIAGILLMAAIYCAFLLHGNRVGDLLGGLTYVLNNPEQSSISENVISALIQTARLSKYVAVPALIMSAIVLLHKSNDRLWFAYLVLQGLLMVLSAFRSGFYLCGAILIPMTVVTFPLCLSGYQNRSVRAVMLYVIGLLNAAAYTVASNTGVDAGTVGFCISAVAGIWLIGETGVKWNRSAARLLTVAMLMLSMLVPMFCQRVIGVYRDAPLVQLNTRLQQGPAMGLYTTKEHAGQYDAICEALRSLSAERPEGRILFCKTLPWAYLCTPYGFGTPSPWRIHTEDLQNYYAIHNENRADFICILSENVGGWEESPFNRNPGVSNPNAFDYEGAFWEEVKTAPVLMETPELTIFEMREIW